MGSDVTYRLTMRLPLSAASSALTSTAKLPAQHGVGSASEKVCILILLMGLDRLVWRSVGAGILVLGWTSTGILVDYVGACGRKP